MPLITIDSQLGWDWGGAGHSEAKNFCIFKSLLLYASNFDHVGILHFVQQLAYSQQHVNGTAAKYLFMCIGS